MGVILWSAIGLSIACSIGFNNFKEYLVAPMIGDLESSFEKNIPVILALLGVWYNNLRSSNLCHPAV